MDTTLSEVLKWYQLAILLGWAGLGIGRGVFMARRGINVLTPDPQRTPPEILLDVVKGFGIFLAFWEVIAYSLRVPFHFGLGFLGSVILDNAIAKIIGAIFLALSLGIYGKSMLDLGAAWRLSIDRASPGPLVTQGIYAFCRHPIYFSFDLFFLGGFLITGRLVFLVLAFFLIPLLHLQMLREERFLKAHHGESYREYETKVRRYGIF